MEKLILIMFKFYKKFISPIFQAMGVKCKYYPTCSEYMVQAIKKYGLLKGILKGLKRILRCNPFSKGGYDPVE